MKQLFRQWQATRKQSGLPSSQEAAAELLGFGQSAVAQYLNGKIPLNVEAGVKFVELLGVELSAFSTDLAKQAGRLAGSVRTAAEPDFLAISKGTRPTAVIAETKPYSPLPPQLQAQVFLGHLDEREAALIHRYRMATTKGKQLVEDMADAVEKEELFVVHHETQSK
ncbi:helix-turn-helix domain-containing protein [Pseudoduganella sp. FT55W]|uniref:Helix-turn-helix domain-containing protein n=1 Tax=Duganella rivi TaxID=2666083 RepID=A0A7X4K8X1_9BURK|nr:helix-turn-helix domain-containing protein [Duganella rivi]